MKSLKDTALAQRISLRPTIPPSGGVVFIGIDLGSPEGDHHTGAVFERQPDGSLRILKMNSWKHDVDLKP